MDDDDGLIINPASYGITTPIRSAPVITPKATLTPKQVDTPTGRKYAQRTNAGGIVTTFGDVTVADFKPDTTLHPRVKPYGTHELNKSYRYMFEGLREKADCLDEITCQLGDHLLAASKDVPAEDVQLDFTPTQPDPFWCTGRVCYDPNEGKLSAHSVLLQGSQDATVGKCLAMDVSRVAQEYSLFPGQIVLARVSNPNGSSLVAEEVRGDASPALVDAADSLNEATGPLSVVVASGPFTTSDNLAYEPLNDLLKYIQNNQVHVLILVGPFLDAKHKNVEACDGEETFDEVFNGLMTTIYAAVSSQNTHVIVVSSSKDVHHNFVYPTPPYESLLPQKALEKFHFFSDPCMVSIEGVVFGITSTDILMHLGREEITTQPGDRMRRLASYVLQQRSFYPLFPPSEEVNVQLDKFDDHVHIREQPHVLILPSDLMHFFKDINGGLVVNPNRLAKSEGGGTFARILVKPRKERGQPFIQRVVADVMRI